MTEREIVDSERRETLDELSDLLVVVQEMGRRLASETHGDQYGDVRILVDLFHQARVQLDKVRGDSQKSD